MASMDTLANLRSTLAADSEWLNIQNIIRETFSMFYDVVHAQSASISRLEERVTQMERSSEEKEKDTGHMKTELRRTRQSIKDLRSQVTEDLAAKLSTEEGAALEERLSRGLAAKAEKDTLSTALAQRPEQTSVEQMMSALRTEVDARVEPAERVVSRVGDLERTLEGVRGQIERTRTLVRNDVRETESRLETRLGTGSQERQQEMDTMRREMETMKETVQGMRETGITTGMMEEKVAAVRQTVAEMRDTMATKVSTEDVKRWLERKVDLKRINAWIQQHTSDLSSVLMGKASVSSVTELRDTVTELREEMPGKVKTDVMTEMEQRCATRRDVDEGMQAVMDRVCGMETAVKRKVDREEFVAMLSEKVDHVEFVHRLDGDGRERRKEGEDGEEGDGSCGSRSRRGGGNIY
eukprot:gb/GECH01001153.1/.p1 GENE.gb/GECH01001153.1/~~gb/GECH01001153.1/.p1  ORF type:complete len:410 (+),score=98.12 gb/GECH01001153.1/:1-1230(+)